MNVAVGVLVLVIVASFFFGRSAGEGTSVVLLEGLMGSAFAALITTLRFRRVFPTATRIDEHAVTLQLPSAKAERLIGQHLAAGTPRDAAEGEPRARDGDLDS